MCEEAHEDMTHRSRLPGHTLHIVEALETDQITPNDFATLRSEIVRDDDVLRFFKSALRSRQSNHKNGVPGV